MKKSYLLLLLSICLVVYSVYNEHKAELMNSDLQQAVDTGQQSVMIAGNNLVDELTTCEEFNPFSKAMDNIGSIPWNATYDNCYDHSKQLSAALAKDGIMSSIMINGNRSHAWVAVWIEATTGHFVNPKDVNSSSALYPSIFEVRDGTNVTNIECSNQ